MRFSCDKSSWVLDQLHPAEWHFICELPEIASGHGLDATSKGRLFPSPIQPDSYDEQEKEAEFLDDWDEFVKPDIEVAFKSAREQVEADVAGGTISEGPHIELPEDATDDQRAVVAQFEAMTWRKIEISCEHVDEWYSTLNQARILLNEVHELAEDDSRYMNSPSVKEEPAFSQDRAMLLTQYEFYAVIQSILIDQLMEL